MMISERELGRALKLELERQRFTVHDRSINRIYSTRFKVYLNKPVQTHKTRFKQFWKTKNLSSKDIPPSQPEIDLIIVDDKNIWRAIELKVIKKTKRGISPPYYVGLGQTFAYLSYGMDEVALWQCFDGNSMTDKEIFDYNDALGKIRAPIEHFVDATYFKILDDKQKLRMQTAVFYHNGLRTWKDGVGIYEPQIEEYRWECRSSNPFLAPFQTPKGICTFKQNVVDRVRAVREFLELQKIELWNNET